jgi:chemotaxis protein methyltransferase CheR
MIKPLQTLDPTSPYLLLKKYLADALGIVLHDNKKDLVLNAIQKRIKHLHMTAVADYLIFIKNNKIEFEFLVNLVTNKTTSFFREKHHFSFLDNYIKTLVSYKHKIRLWSAGCSTGEEPYSIAMTLLDCLDLSNQDIKILATDINTQALEIAKSGLYTIDEIKTLGSSQHWFRTINECKSPKYAINDQVKKLVQFQTLNLVDHWPMKGQFDVIFFRNVAIYMTPEANYTLLKRIDRSLVKGGIIMIGHAESLDMFDNYLSLGKSIYQKKNDS